MKVSFFGKKSGIFLCSLEKGETMTNHTSSLVVRKLVYSAICLTLGLVLPFLTGQIPQIGGMLCPMHIPVLLCGFLCGWPWGLAVGFITPLLRSVCFGMPPLFPTATAMAFELAAYGALSGLLYKKLPRNTLSIYVALLLSMLGGRVVWGAVQFVLMGISGSEFPFSAFLAGAITNALPGIVLHILLIPMLVYALRKARLSLNEG